MGEASGADTPAHRRRGSFLRTAQAVAWSFFGVRKAADYAQDVGQLNPLHVVIAGLIAVAVFIGLLLVLVNWVLSSGVAA